MSQTNEKHSPANGKCSQMIKERRRKQGSQFVEAAIALPIVILALASFLFLAIATHQVAVSYHEKALEIEEYQVASGQLALAKKFADIFISDEIAEKIGLNDETIETVKTLLSETTETERVSLNIPFSLINRPSRQTIVKYQYNLFTGSDEETTGLGRAALEKRNTTLYVYVFPKRGEKYHDLNCRIVSSYAIRALLTDSIRKKYKPCSICNPEELDNGTPIYYFKSGECYHREGCSKVKRTIKQMAISEAIERNYTPCSYCQTNSLFEE